ncbi:hypothetical protein KIH74_35675, partial [Kineosporia sp. J2-2]
TLRDLRDVYEIILAAPRDLPVSQQTPWIMYDIPRSHEVIVRVIRGRLEALGWSDLLGEVDDGAGDRIGGLVAGHPVVVASDPRRMLIRPGGFEVEVRLEAPSGLERDEVWLSVDFLGGLEGLPRSDSPPYLGAVSWPLVAVAISWRGAELDEGG